ncbi:hypothetical protein LNQ52_22545 [Klebsiella pneumoniae subsp. pneumoniae]|nr:hypothetical protein [Klebsiella pneumoniae subsp. pneumoniae]
MPWLKVGFFLHPAVCRRRRGDAWRLALRQTAQGHRVGPNLGRKLPIVAGLLMASSIITANWLEATWR